MVLITEAERLYRKTRVKRIHLDLIVDDFNRWSCYASIKKLPLSTMIRKAVEEEISEMEDAFDSTVEDILNYQNELKKV